MLYTTGVTLHIVMQLLVAIPSGETTEDRWLSGVVWATDQAELPFPLS